MCLWPGLPQLWFAGRWTGLVLAVGFAALLNLVLLASLRWTDWWEPRTLVAGWIALTALWLIAGIGSMATGSARKTPAEENDSFSDAVEHYLKGDLYQAELMFRRMIRRDHHDVDSHLMLTGLLRQSGRLSEATRQLEVLTRIEGAEKWQLETDQERKRIERRIEATKTDEAKTNEPETNQNVDDSIEHRSHAA